VDGTNVVVVTDFLGGFNKLTRRDYMSVPSSTIYKMFSLFNENTMHLAKAEYSFGKRRCFP
jgi:hypothetical protein